MGTARVPHSLGAQGGQEMRRGPQMAGILVLHALLIAGYANGEVGAAVDAEEANSNDHLLGKSEHVADQHFGYRASDAAPEVLGDAHKALSYDQLLAKYERATDQLFECRADSALNAGQTAELIAELENHRAVMVRIRKMTSPTETSRLLGEGGATNVDTLSKIIASVHHTAQDQTETSAEEENDRGASARCQQTIPGVKEGLLDCSKVKMKKGITKAADCPDGITPMGFYFRTSPRKWGELAECKSWINSRLKAGIERSGQDPNDPETQIINKMQVRP